MKWIGQHIWDFISRFRADVYLEGVTESAQDHIVGIDADGKLYKQDVPVGDITGVTAGNALTGGGTSGTVTINHEDTSSQASVDNSGSTFIQDVTLDTYGHVTGLTSTAVPTLNQDTTGTAATVTAAAQPNITSVGTLTALNVDDVNIDGPIITITGDTDDTFAIRTTTHGATTISTTDTAGAQADLTLAIDGLISSTSTSFSAITDDFTIASSTSAHPTVMIANTTNDATGGELVLHNKRGAAGVDGDICGLIHFKAPNHDGSDNFIFYSSIVGSIVESNDTDEAGKLELYVATSNGSTSAPQAGLVLTGSSSDNDVDISIGYGATSLTTITGDLQVNGNEIKDDDGTTCITFDSSGNVTTNLLTCTSSAAAAITLNHTLSNGSPFMAFSQDGTRRSFIQHHNTDDKFRFASEFGAISLEAASSAGTDSNTAYLVIDPGGTFTLGAENSDVVLTTDGNMTFRVDSDNDETNGNFIFQHNASTQIATLDENGNFATSGVVTAAKGHKYNPTDNADGSHQGDIVYIDAATASTTAGKVYYLNSSGSWTIANADAEADASGMLAVAIDSNPDVDGMVLRGMVTAYDIAGTPAVGAAVYLSATDGVLTTVKPTTSGHIVRHVGYIQNATHDQIWFNPDSTYIEI